MDETLETITGLAPAAAGTPAKPRRGGDDFGWLA
jgi:hypothetical protein